MADFRYFCVNEAPSPRFPQPAIVYLNRSVAFSATAERVVYYDNVERSGVVL